MPIIAQLANGSKLEFNAGTAANTWVEAVGVTNFNAPGITRQEVDVTWLGSTNKETLPSTPEYSDLTGTIQLVPGNAIDTLLKTHNISGQQLNVRTTFPTGNTNVVETYVGWVKSYDRKATGHGSKMEADFAFAINGPTEIE